jgi:hypothetical protein
LDTNLPLYPKLLKYWKSSLNTFEHFKQFSKFWINLFFSNGNPKKLGFHHVNCCNFNLGLASKSRTWKMCKSRNATHESHSHSHEYEKVKEWAHTLPSGFPLWELEYWWIPKFLNYGLKGQNSLDWILPLYHWKVLKM